MTIEEANVVESTAVEVYEHQPVSLFHTDDPVEIIEKATAVANALKSVVASRGLITMISGREHPKVEAWQTLGSMLGVFPVKEWVREIPWPEPIPAALKSAKDAGRSFGFEASFIAQRADGTVVGGGEAACTRTENMWKGRDDYALRSMAQTRATSKALKGPLGFVMSLAGYETTPAEEMPAEPPRQAPAPVPTPAPTSNPDPGPFLLAKDIVDELVAAKKETGKDDEWVRQQLVAVGLASVPSGKVTLATIRKLTDKQAMRLLERFEAATEGAGA